jgi:fucose permease
MRAVPSAARPTVVLLAYVAFVSLGLPDTVLGVAWPSLRRSFELSQAAMGAALSVHVAGYFVSGLAAGRASGALGLGSLLALSTALVSAGLAGFAVAPSWAVFIACAALVGLGSGAIDAGLNGYAAVHLGQRHMNWLHACYSLGATLGPTAMTAALARASYRAGYAALSATLGAMAVAFVATRARWDGRGAAGGFAVVSARAALRLPVVWLQVAIFFAYTGLEASAGQWAFTVLREARGLSLEAAGAWTAAYWGSIAGGRIAIGFAVDRLGADRLVRAGSLGAVAGALLYALLPGAAGAAGLALLGLSLAPIFPLLMARTPERVGAAAAHAIGFQVAAATLGTAVLPSAHGAIADALGARAIPPALAGLAGLVAGLVALLNGTSGRRRGSDRP